jgi:hypothetical protein
MTKPEAVPSPDLPAMTFKSSTCVPDCQTPALHAGACAPGCAGAVRGCARRCGALHTPATCGMRAASTRAIAPACATPTSGPSRRLLQYPAVRGDCVGAFGECSRDLHSLLHDTVRSAAERHWREAGATSARAATSFYTAIYRRRWGCETARLRYRMRDCGSRVRTLRLVATPGAPAEPPARPSTQGMLTISRPPPRRCSAACLPAGQRG